MNRPVGAIFLSLGAREARRVDVALVRGGLVAAACLVLLPMAASARDPLTIGRTLLLTYFVLSGLAVFYLALRLAGDSVGDRRSGFNSLLMLTGLAAESWLLVRLAQMWTSFLSVWIARLPLLSLIMTFGGVTWPLVLTAELLLLLAFFAFSAFCLFMADLSNTRQELMNAGPMIAFWELLLHAPRLLLSALQAFVSWRSAALPAFRSEQELIDILERYLNGTFGELLLWVADGVMQTSLFYQCSQLFAGTPSPWRLWPAAVMYGGLAIWILWRYRCIVFARRTEDDPRIGHEPTPSKRGKRGTSRTSRRSWDDAFAWQAYCVHGGGDVLLRNKWTGYTLVVAGVLVVSQTRIGLDLTGAAAVFCVVSLIISVNKVGDCLQREIKEQTLPILMLTPHEPDEIYDGWRRGTWWLSVPDLVAWGVISMFVVTVHRDLPAAFLGAGGAILASGPLLTVSPLVPYSLSGWAQGCCVAFLLVALAVFSIMLGVAFHPWAFPVSAISLACLLNWPLKRFILVRRWNEKVSSMP